LSPAGKLRATASAQMKDDPNRQELLEHYSAMPDGYQRTLGVYLIGTASESDLLRYASEKSRCAIAYYIGMKNAAEGNLERACEWYRASVETGQSSIEFGMAANALQGWANGQKSLERIAAEQ
jgi:hypothetical protein